jgi:hypothetical protein
VRTSLLPLGRASFHPHPSIGGRDPPTQFFIALGGRIKCAHGGNWGPRRVRHLRLWSRPMARVPAKAKKPKLLSGGNPQIAKGYGEAPVRAYIAAMPGWKREVGKKLDALITHTIPAVKKAVKYNSPLYGVEEGFWFMSFHCFEKYVKVAFFKGASLMPMPPGPSKQKEVRYLDIREGDWLNEVQLADWVKQVSKLPGERL